MYGEFALHFMYQTLLVLVVQKYFYYLLNLLSFGNFCDNNDLSGILYLKTTSCAHEIQTKLMQFFCLEAKQCIIAYACG